MKMLIVGKCGEGGGVSFYVEFACSPHPHRLSFLVSSGWSVRLEKSACVT